MYPNRLVMSCCEMKFSNLGELMLDSLLEKFDLNEYVSSVLPCIRILSGDVSCFLTKCLPYAHLKRRQLP